MSQFWNTWANAHRNARALVIVAVMTPVLLWAAYIEYQERHRSIVKKETLTGVVISIFNHNQFYRGRIKLSENQHVDLVLVQPIPDIGDVVPITVIYYSDGSQYYHIDAMEWQMSGG